MNNFTIVNDSDIFCHAACHSNCCRKADIRDLRSNYKGNNRTLYCICFGDLL